MINHNRPQKLILRTTNVAKYDSLPYEKMNQSNVSRYQQLVHFANWLKVWWSTFSIACWRFPVSLLVNQWLCHSVQRKQIESTEYQIYHCNGEKYEVSSGNTGMWLNLITNKQSIIPSGDLSYYPSCQLTDGLQTRYAINLRTRRLMYTQDGIGYYQCESHSTLE